MSPNVVLTWAGTIGSVMLTLAGFYMGWRRYQDERLRSRDVAAWADRSIASLIDVELCAKNARHLPEIEFENRLVNALFLCSQLTEQGRLFFRNTKDTNFRPKVLDSLVISHKIAHDLLYTKDFDFSKLAEIAEVQRRDFVRLVQGEIGRRQTRYKEARTAGETSDLNELVNQKRR